MNSKKKTPRDGRVDMACSIDPYNYARWQPSDALVSIAASGFDGVEMHAPLEFGDERSSRLSQLLEINGLLPAKYLTAGYGIELVPATMALQGVDREKALASYTGELEIARTVGFPSMVVFAGMHSPTPEKHETEFTLASQTLNELAALADEYGVKLLVETHAGSIAHDAESFLGLRAFGNHHNLYANVDPSNYAAVGADPAMAIKKLGALVGGVHIKDMVAGTQDNPLWAPPGHGVVDWVEVLDALAEVSYRGPLAVEYEAGITGAFPVDAEHGSRRSLAYIRTLLDERGGWA